MAMQNHKLIFILVLIFIFNGQSIQLCQKISNHVIHSNTYSISNRCFIIEQCHLTIFTDVYHYIVKLKQNNDTLQWLFSSKFQLLINNDQDNARILFSLISKNNESVNTTTASTMKCYAKLQPVKRNARHLDRTGSTSSIVITFNSSSFIDYHHKDTLDYPLRLSVRFRTLGRISNGVLLSLIHHSPSSPTTPFIIIEHTDGKIEVTILQLSETNALSTVTTIQCGRNVNNDNWHKLHFEIDRNGAFEIIVDGEIRSSIVPTYVVASWNINALLVGDTRRLERNIFRPFIGYMSDLIFNDEYLFTYLTTRKQQIQSSFHYSSQHIMVGYRIAFFNLITIDTQTSYIAFSERENQNKNHGKLDIYFLFRSYVPDGLILYRYAQGLNEYFAIGLRSGILTLFIDFGYGKRQIVSDESTRLADGKWHEVRVTRIGTDKIELVVDNRVNRSALSTNGIRNAVSLQPVLYIGGIPHINHVNLMDSGLNSFGFQGCLSSFIVDGHLLDYRTALVLHGKVEMDVCSDLNKLCYDFTCLHAGRCLTNKDDGPRCDCIETGYTGDRCDKLPNGFYFGTYNSIGSVIHAMAQARQTEHDIFTFGLQTSSTSAEIFRLESDLDFYSLEYEIVNGRSYIELSLGEKQSNIYSAIVHITDGLYHAIKLIRRFSLIELYVDGTKIQLDGGNSYTHQLEQEAFLAQRQLKIGNFKNKSVWNGIIAGFTFNRQPLFDSLRNTLIRSGDIMDVYPDPNSGQFNLTSTTILSSTTITIPSTSILTSPMMNITMEYSTTPVIGYLYNDEETKKINIITPKAIQNRGMIFQWLFDQIKYYPVRSLIIGSIIASCFLLFLLFIIIRLHCTTSENERKTVSTKHGQTNGKAYSQLQPTTKRYSIVPTDVHESKKRVPNFLQHLHTDETTKPTSFRLASTGADSYQLISSLKDSKSSPFRNSDCVLNEHCCVHSSLSQPMPSSPSSSMYHQINRLMMSGSDPPLPLPNVSQSSHCHQIATATLRSLKKEIDNSSSQTYSAVYSCEPVANLDIDQDIAQKRLSIKRRSILKNTQSGNIQTKILFLYVKNSVDYYALQPTNRNNKEPIVLATVDENRVQLSHALTGSFHSRLPVSSVGACHSILFTHNGQYLIGLFYEITSNINPYAVKLWSTNDYILRKSPHPIKCSLASASQHSSILYMAGKQKYGRGISLGLLDLDSCSLTRELKSDPDTLIGDEIKRIILTQSETNAIIACTEHSSTHTCFVVFKLDSIMTTNEQSALASTGMSNCTMILTKFDCDSNHAYSINDEQMLTILRTNQILIWKLNDGDISYKHEFHHLNSDNKIREILSTQLNNNRLLILMEQGIIHIWDVTFTTGQFSLVTTISEPLIHAISWLDQRHFISVDQDGQRIRTWNIQRKDSINEFISSNGTIKSLDVHSISSDLNKRQEYLIIGRSQTERHILIFEYTQPFDEQTDSSNISIC